MGGNFNHSRQAMGGRVAPTWVIGKTASDTLVDTDCHLWMNVCCQDGEAVQAQYLEGQELADC